jgi:hypothetical protein
LVHQLELGNYQFPTFGNYPPQSLAW